MSDPRDEWSPEKQALTDAFFAALDDAAVDAPCLPTPDDAPETFREHHADQCDYCDEPAVVHASASMPPTPLRQSCLAHADQCFAQVKVDFRRALRRADTPEVSSPPSP